jgi:hypothetical protein
MKRGKLLIVLIILLLFLVGCAKEISKEELAQELDNLTEEELNYVLSEEENALAGQAYQFSSGKIAKLKYLRKMIPKIDYSDVRSNYQLERLSKEIKESYNLLEINVEENFDRRFRINYHTHLINENNMKIYFSYEEGKLIVYSMINHLGEDYLLSYDTFDSGSVSYFPRNIYSNGEKININNFNESAVVITIRDNCVIDYPYCDSIPENTNDYYFIESDIFTYYSDNSLFNSNVIRDSYINRVVDVDKVTINFLQNNLGIFPPVDKLVQFNIYASYRSGVSAASGFWIVNYKNGQITQEQIDNLQYGNTHEFVHLFFFGTPVEKNWFEEGLADYMEHLQKGNLANLYCRENGWEYGYYDGNDNFVSNSPLIPYSDFTVSPQDTTDFYDPLNPPNYYRSAECLWIYIEENYGSEAIKKITQAWHDTRKVLPPQKKWLIRDIINPTLEADLSSLVQARYNYVEDST